MGKVGILVIDDDAAGQATLRQILESEAWELHAEPVASKALQELATGAWTLVIASIGMTGLAGPLYATLRELALAPLSEEGKARLRVLFVIPENAEQQTRSTLESDHLPYVQKPFNLHDSLKTLKIPTLVIHGDADPIPPSTAQVTHESIENSKYILVENCGHFPYVEEPKAYFDHLKNFMIED